MKPHALVSKKLMAVLLPLVVCGSSPLPAAPAVQPAKVEIPQSFFLYPTKPQEGRDPFFPNSTRPYADNPDKPVSRASLSDLTIQGIASAGNRTFAIINNRTFASGEEGDIKTKNGQRLTIRCLSIDVKAGKVRVEANGASDVLQYQGNP